MQTFSKGGGGKKFKMVFEVESKGKMRLFYFSSKMGSAFIAAENRQSVFLVAEKWAGCILDYRKTGRALHPLKSALGKHYFKMTYAVFLYF